MYQAVVAVFFCLIGEADGAGVSIFKLGTLIDTKQWTVMYMYFGVFLITIILELIVHTAHHKVSTTSGKAVMHHVTQEVMILGGIAAVLIVFENLGGKTLIDVGLFHYVHFVVFVMAIFFITMVSSLFSLVDRSWAKWARFEHQLKSIETDPSLTEESRSAFVAKFIHNTPGGDKMAASLIFFEANLPERFRGVSFSRYMGKMQRKLMLHFLHLDIASWTLLSVLMLLAAIVTGVTNVISSNPLATIGLWVLIIGYGSLFALIVVFFKIRRAFSDFAVEVQELKQDGVKIPKNKQASYFWSSPHFMTRIMQTALLYQVFFLATTIVNFSYRLATSGSLGWLMILGCVGPTLVVFFIMIPIIMPPFTVLASLGEYLDHDTILSMIAGDKASGKWRRQWNREGEMIAPSQFVSEVVGVLTREDEPEKHVFDVMNDHPTCDECNLNQATMFCEDCGYLCVECENDYHRLKRNRHHTRRPVNTDAEEAANKRLSIPKYSEKVKRHPLRISSLPGQIDTQSVSHSADSSIGPQNESIQSSADYQPLLEDEGTEKKGKRGRRKHHRKDRDRDKDSDKSRTHGSL